MPVGTGQAIVAACEGEHRDRYPFYAAGLFDRVRATTDAFPELYDRAVETPLDDFLRAKTNVDDPWQALRDNHRTSDRFVRACHERLDGLRILQYLKAEYRRSPTDDRTTLVDWLERHGSRIEGSESEAERWHAVLEKRQLHDLTTPELDAIRRMLFKMEDGYRLKDDLVDG